MRFPYKLIDLTHTLDSTIPTWDGECGFNHELHLDHGDCEGEDKFHVMKQKRGNYVFYNTIKKKSSSLLNRESKMKSRINIITLGPKNLERATKFYEQGLGLSKMDFDGDISFFTLNGTWLSLYPWELLAQDALVEDVGSGFRGFTLAYNVENERRVVELLEKAQNAGATIIKLAQKTEWGGFSRYFSDLGVHLWEVAYNPFFWPGPKEG